MSVNRFQDIHISDKELRQRYISFFMDGDYASAFEILTDNPQLDRKAFVADCINDISEILHELQSDTLGGTTDYLNTLSNKFDVMVSQFIDKGDWSSTEEYRQYNFVLYNELVYMYINSEASTGNLPTDDNYWLLIGLKGETGAGGASDMRLMYYWDANTYYKQKDLVMTLGSGRMWVAKIGNFNNEPRLGSQYWEVFMQVQPSTIISSASAPTSNYVGQIWFDIT